MTACPVVPEPRVFVGRDSEGKVRYHNKTVTGNKKDALAYARETETKRDTGQPLVKAKVTLNSHLDYWLKQVTAGSVQENTLADYTRLMNKHVRPILGNKLLTEIQIEAVQTLYNDLSRAGLSGRTVRYVHSVLSAALNHAVLLGRIHRNPASFTRRPANEPRQIEVFTEEDAAAFLDAANEDRYKALWMLALATGPRPEEYCGLQWQDLDLDKGQAQIQRVLIWKENGGGWELRPYPKTKSSRRTITFPQAVSQALADHRRRQMEERLKAGGRYQNNDLVFATASAFHPDAWGSPLRRHNLYRDHMTPILERAELLARRFTLYTLRHTFATLALASGVDPKWVSEMLGHSSVAFTLDTYYHLIPKVKRQATEQIENILFKRAVTQ